MGLKDQKLAIQWVSDNIECFGGDKEKITLFGESAGGASTHFHVVVPESKKLYQRAIIQSGSVWNSWSYNIRSDDKSTLIEFGTKIFQPLLKIYIIFFSQQKRMNMI